MPSYPVPEGLGQRGPGSGVLRKAATHSEAAIAAAAAALWAPSTGPCRPADRGEDSARQNASGTGVFFPVAAELEQVETQAPALKRALPPGGAFA